MSEERPDWQRRHLWQFQSVRDLLLLAAIIGILYLGYVLSPVTVPMLIGLALAYLMEPVVATCGRRWGWATRPRVVVGSLLGLMLLFIVALVLTVPLVIRQTADLANKSGGYIQTLLEAPVEDYLPEWMGDELQRLRQQLGAPDARANPGASDAEGRAAQDVQAAGDAPERASRTQAGGGEPDEAVVRRIVRDELASRERGGVGDQAGELLPAIGRVLRTAYQVVSVLATGVIGLAIAVFLVGFFYIVFGLNYPRVIGFAREFVPNRHRERADDLARQMDRAVAGFVRGRLVIAGILSVVFAVGWLLCGVPYAILLGLTVGILTLVPYLSGLGILIAYALVIVEVLGGQGAGWYTSDDGAINWWLVAILPAIPFVVAQILDDYVLSPTIQGKATNLSPAAIVVAVLAGGILAGVYGMLLAIPVAACVRITAVEVVWPHIQAWTEGERQDPLPIDGD